jgi:hypothetical protein
MPEIHHGDVTKDTTTAKKTGARSRKGAGAA